MNTRILNREGKIPNDGWYQIEVPGEHVNHGARVVEIIDAKAVESIVNRFIAEAKDAGDNFAGLPIDKDHLSESLDNPTEALGWAMQVRNRDGAIESRIDWTALGQPLVESKPNQPPAYKFFSTEYEPSDCEQIGKRIVNKKSYAIIRPLRLAGLSLTNDPNNKGQRPISNRHGTPAEAAENQDTHIMKSLLKELGLADDASEESAVAAVKAIKNRASQVEALTTERDALLSAQVDADLEKYKNRFKPENREKFKAMLIKNRASTIELLELIPAEAAQAPATPTRITNRATAATPSDASSSTDAQESARAQKITNRALEIQKQKSARGATYPWAMAFAEATTENPAPTAAK